MKWLICILLGVAVLAYFLSMGLLNLRRAIIDELQESADAVLALQQGFTIAGMTGAKKDAEAKPMTVDDGVAIPNEKVENLNFSEKTLKQLKAAGLNDVSDLLELRGNIARHFELDPETLNEVASKLQELRNAAAK